MLQRITPKFLQFFEYYIKSKLKRKNENKCKSWTWRSKIKIRLDSALWINCLLHMLSLKDIFESDSLEHQMKMNLKEKMTDSKIVPNTSCQFIFWRLPKVNRKDQQNLLSNRHSEWKLNEVWCQMQTSRQYVHLL